MSPNPHVLWLTFPAYGHLKQTLGIVRELTRRGCRVSYSVPDRLAAKVDGHGARVVPYPSEFPATITSTESATEMTMAFVHEGLAPLESVLGRLASDPPDLVVYDALSAETATSVSRRYGIPAVRVYPGFGTNEFVPQNGTEPSADHEPVDPDDPALRQFAAEMIARVNDLGVADLLAGGALRDDEVALNISFVTKAFQIRGETFGDEYAFVGPCLRDEDFAGRWSPGRPDWPTVLVSLGTSVNRRPDFFATCAGAFAGLEWNVVMTLGDGVEPADLGTLPDNVRAYSWVPHLAVLAHADVFVCQGGTGSLMESFHRGVPAVVVPQQWDQNAIADQVAALGLGVAVPPAESTAVAIRDAVLRVAADDGFRRRARAMSAEVVAAGGALAAANAIERCLTVVPVR